MNNQVVRDFVLILLVYAICGGLVYAAVVGNWPTELGVQPGKGDTDKLLTADEFKDGFQTWAGIVAGISLLCMIVWYVLGEWGPRANKVSAAGWLITWFLLLLVVVLAVLGAFFMGPKASEHGEILVAFYFFTGVFFYFWASVLFSPTSTKYAVPGSRMLRKNW